MEHFFILPKAWFPAFFELMQEFGKVHAPVRVSDQSFAYKPVMSPEEIAFEALRTILPPKKYFYPQRETLVKYSGHEVTEQSPELVPQVIFGVHPCDLAGLGFLDKIFSAEPADSHYLARREATLIVGLSCMPDKYCFCNSMGSDSPNGAYDLFLTDIGDDFFVQVNTARGQRLVEVRPDLMQVPADEHRDRYKQFWVHRDEAFQTGFKSDNLPAIVDMEWDNPVWKELGERCLSCGNCTPVCPTCYCFDIIDIASLEGNSGERQREWDSCQFSGFAMVAGGFNFRQTPVDRLKFWYRHKLHGFDDPAGLPGCVGCGRCTVSCPAGIDDIVNVVLRLQGEAREDNNDAT
ncbi:MAG TPA: 4Fe-4S dicluster domain-containing protein [Candidatus Obscuribacterales bacterium]